MCNREELTEINKKSKENVQHTKKKNPRSKIIFCNSVTVLIMLKILQQGIKKLLDVLKKLCQCILQI